jgi:pimeloyl-ACP methyl ester carboxylesterase
MKNVASPDVPRLTLFTVSCVLALLLTAGIPQGYGQEPTGSTHDPNLAHPTKIVTVAGKGYTVAGLVTHADGVQTFKHGIALFPGFPGIMKLREESGRASFELRGNFLIRSRRHWVDGETLVVVVDAPSDQWATFTQTFRETPRYGADVAALLGEVARQFTVEEWTLVGTSEGSVSAFHAARMNPELARRMILTASIFQPTNNGPGLSWVSWDKLPSRLLWAHHESDPCRYTAYRDARRFAERSKSPLLTVRGGGPWRGDACAAFTAHGFVGLERETVLAMRSWVKTGVVPPDVTP